MTVLTRSCELLLNYTNFQYMNVLTLHRHNQINTSIHMHRYVNTTINMVRMASHQEGEFVFPIVPPQRTEVSPCINPRSLFP